MVERKSTCGDVHVLLCSCHMKLFKVFFPDKCVGVHVCIYVFWPVRGSTHMTEGEILAFTVPTNQNAKLPTRLL